jgi:membrane-associated protein
MMSFLSATALSQTLLQWVAAYGPWALGLVALIIFAETGLVVAPFLPGDSLLFLTGTVTVATGLNVHVAVVVLAAAAIAGDGLNFLIGRHAGSWFIDRGGVRWIKLEHIRATQGYFQRWGGATIVVARFVPVVRTVAPFLAGAGRMHPGTFVAYNVFGGIAWVASLVYAGAYFGTMPLVRDHIELFTLGIVAVSLVPLLVTAIRSRRVARRASGT